MDSRMHGNVRMWRRDLAGPPSYLTRMQVDGRYFLIFRERGRYALYETRMGGLAQPRGWADTLAAAGRVLASRFGAHQG